jgi:membrane-anchored glycerophosphoryl diester phosphodiesterase (GDPDase)
MITAMNAKSLLKAQAAVGALVALAVGLFLLIYFALGDSTPASTRLISALIVPPLVIGVIMGGYVLVRGR